MVPGKFVAIVLLFFMMFGMNSLMAQTEEQSLVRIFSFEPHPTSARFPQKVPFNKGFYDLDVTFNETWKENNGQSALQQISFSLQILRDSTVIASSTSEIVSLDGVRKNQKLSSSTLGDITFNATAKYVDRKAGGITDLTVAFIIAYPRDSVIQAQNALDNQKTSSSLELARKLVGKADLIPAKSIKAKLVLLRKALLVTPAPESSPEAENFNNQIADQISALENALASQEATAPAEPENSNPTEQTNQEMSSAGQQPGPKTNEKALELYNQARAFFAQEKGPEGREALRKALEIAPDYRNALLLLGDNAYNNRKFARAKEAYDKVLLQNENDAPTLLKYFKSCYYMGEGAEAIIRLEEIKARHHTDKEIKLTLIEAYFQFGNLESAQAMCQDILRIDPANSTAKDLLQRINHLMR